MLELHRGHGAAVVAVAHRADEAADRADAGVARTQGGDFLLQVLDDGRLTDGQGRTVDFKNTVIVMTSNLGSQHIMALSGEKDEVIREAVWGEVKAHFRPEFLNRIDETVIFHALGADHIKSIARIQLRLLEARLDKMEIQPMEYAAFLSAMTSKTNAPGYLMMISVLRKSTVRPWPSVRRPSSSTCNSTLKTSGCAFSISSNSTT